jgi:hypothetical protein
MENPTSHNEPGPESSRWKIPRDGVWRYLYDIWQPLVLLLLTTCFTAAFYSTYNPQVSQNPDNLFFCNADGNVEKSEPEYQSLWDPDLYFTVNIAFGRFAFSIVKVIDAGWDAVIGRGGQMLAAVLAYRTLRRSLTLTMETSTVTMPTVATLYCYQVQLVSLGKLTKDILSHRTSTHPKRQRPIYLGKLRLGMQMLICGYVLLFATLVSVMSGYRAQLTGYFGYDPQSASQLQPVSEISQPRMVVFNGSRIGLSDSPIYAREKIPIPPIEGTGTRYNISELIDDSRDFEEPFGVLVDCK